MATFQGITGFFLPSQRRSRDGGGGGAPTDPALSRALAGVDEILEGMNAPANVGKYLRDDLKDSFKIKQPIKPPEELFEPAYQPGRIPAAEVNLVDLVTDPIGTAWSTVKKPFESDFANLVPVSDVFMTEVDKAVWEHLYSKVWLDEEGKPVVPGSTQSAVAIWNQRKGLRITRSLAADAVRDNPGMIAMKARRLELFYAQKAGATYDAGDIAKQEKFRQLRIQAQEHETNLNSALTSAKKFKEDGDKLAKSGDLKGARKLWDQADAQWREADKLQISVWKGGPGKDIKGEVDKEFSSLSSGLRDPLFNSPEARFIRFWEMRNVHYAALNLVKTYKKEGVWGVVKVYAWKEATKRLKKYYYATHVGDAVNAVAVRLGVTGFLRRLTNLQTLAKRVLNARNIVKQALVKAAKWVINRAFFQSFLAWVGGLIGGAASGGVAAPIGAAIGFVAGFVGDWLVGKVGDVLKIVGYVLVAIIGFFTLFAIGITTLIAIILSNKPYPWEPGGSAGGPLRFVEIEKCARSSPTGSCQTPLRLSNGTHTVYWEIKVKSTSSEPLEGLELSDERCGASESGFRLDPNEERVWTCSERVSGKDTFVTNRVSVAGAVPSFTATGAGIVILGNPASFCFKFEGSWDGNEQTQVMDAAAVMLAAPVFARNLCRGGDISLVRISGRGWNYVSGNTIHLSDIAFDSRIILRFTLAHESGHVYQHHNGGTYSDYCRTVFNKNCSSIGGSPGGEGFIRTYPLGQTTTEDFAEMIGMHVAWRGMSWRCCGSVNFPSEYPSHFNFAKQNIFGGYEY